MYNDELSARRIAVDDIYLDPNNPRFRSRSQRQVSDEKVPNDQIQKKTREDIAKFGIDELCNSILRNGFLPLDRIVVRPLSTDATKFIVVEGNRRTAAVKTLRERIEQEEIAQEDLTSDYLSSLNSSLSYIDCLVYQGGDDFISWILQGIRHLSGIKPWAPFQRAELIVKQIDEDKKSFTEVGEVFGLTRQQVGRLYRGYKGLQQMQQDEEYGAKASTDLFSLFDEAWKNPNVRKWLDWQENPPRFNNETNLRMFYSWIVKDEELEEPKRRIHDPRHVKILDRLVSSKADDLISKIDEHSLTIEAAEAHLGTSGPTDWELEVNKAKKSLESIPANDIVRQPDAVLGALSSIRQTLDSLINLATTQMAAQVRTQSND